MTSSSASSVARRGGAVPGSPEGVDHQRDRPRRSSASSVRPVDEPTAAPRRSQVRASSLRSRITQYQARARPPARRPRPRRRRRSRTQIALTMLSSSASNQRQRIVDRAASGAGASSLPSAGPAVAGLHPALRTQSAPTRPASRGRTRGSSRAPGSDRRRAGAATCPPASRIRRAVPPCATATAAASATAIPPG